MTPLCLFQQAGPKSPHSKTALVFVPTENSNLTLRQEQKECKNAFYQYRTPFSSSATCLLPVNEVNQFTSQQVDFYFFVSLVLFFELLFVWLFFCFQFTTEQLHTTDPKGIIQAVWVRFRTS